MGQVCAQCGTESGDDAKFCPTCGAPLAGASAGSEDVRKTITIVFCDLVGSTSLAERTDPEVLRVILERYFSAVRGAAERHGGEVEKFIGDAVVARFGVPLAREDDALRALRSAFDMRAAIEALNPELESTFRERIAVRIGVNTGEVYVGARAGYAVGDALNIAARLEQAAAPGEIVVGEETWLLVRDRARGEPLAPLEVKGKGAALRAWRATRVSPVSESRPLGPGARAALVGRTREMDVLTDLFERIVADRTCQLVTVYGAPGVGKSRLASELTATLASGVRVVTGRCLPYGDGTSLWALAEAVRSSLSLGARGEDLPTAGGTGEHEAVLEALRATLAGDPDAAQVVEYLASVIGVGDAEFDPEELHWAVRKWVEHLASDVPLLWVAEDLHWARPRFLAVLEDVVDWVRGVPVMVLCLARPELAEEHPTWGGGKLNSASLLLPPLNHDDAARLVVELAREQELSTDELDELVSASAGTPLFVEQFLAMLADEADPTSAGIGTRAGRGIGSVPPSIGALLTARIERLAPAERRVLEVAAVALRETFYTAQVIELTGLDPTTVTAALRALVKKDMVRPSPSDLPGEQGYTITHALVGDAAYQQLPKLVRARLHEQVANWLDTRSDRMEDAPDELVGHHLGVASVLLGEIGDARGKERLGSAAAERLRKAAWRMTSDVSSAVHLYHRAATLVDPESIQALDLQLREGVALFRDSQFAAATSLLSRVIQRAETAGDRGVVLRARLAWAEAALHTGEDVPLAALDEAVAEALAHFAASGDDEVLAAVHLVHVRREALVGHWAGAAKSSELSMACARRAGDRYMIQLARSWWAAALVWGPIPAPDGLAALRREAESPGVGRINRALLGNEEGVLLAYRGDVPAEEVWAVLGAAEQVFVDTRHSYGLLRHHYAAALAGIALGDYARSEHHLRIASDDLSAAGEHTYRSTHLALLGWVRMEQGDPEEAGRLARFADELGREDDVATQGLWRAVAARSEAALGSLAGARSLATEGATLLGRSDMSTLAGYALEAEAEVLEASGDPGRARRSLSHALARFKEKGNSADVRRVDARLAAL